MDTQIIISGAGVPGLSLACLLGREGVNVALVDPYKPDSLSELKKNRNLSGHTTALMTPSIDVLNDLDVMADIHSLAGVLNAMRIVDVTTDRTQHIEKTFDALEIDQSHFGLNIPGNILRAALAYKVEKYPSVTTYYGQAVSDFSYNNDSSIIIRLDNGKQIKSQLVIGADGRRSLIRSLARINILEHDYNQDALTFLIDHSKGHHNISTEFHRPGGPLTFVPLQDENGEDHKSSVVWVENRKRAQDYLKLKKQDFLTALQDASHGVLGELSLASTPHARSLCLIAAKSLWSKRVVLVGEAAHTLHPMGAQGLNLSLRDVRDLGQILHYHMSLGLDPGSDVVLRAYAKKRRLDTASRLLSSHALATSLHHNIGVLHHIRQKALQMLTGMSPIKIALMRAGLSG